MVKNVTSYSKVVANLKVISVYYTVKLRMAKNKKQSPWKLEIFAIIIKSVLSYTTYTYIQRDHREKLTIKLNGLK